MKPHRPRLLAIESQVCREKPRRSPPRARPERPASLSVSTRVFDFDEPLSLQVGRAFSTGSSYSEPSPEIPEPARMETAPPSARVEAPAAEPEPVDAPAVAPVTDEAAREDLRAVTQAPTPRPGMVQAHEIFDRISRGEAPPPAPVEDKAKEKNARPAGRGHEVFDRMDMSRAATFDAGEFAIEQTLDRLDQIMDRRKPDPAPMPPAESPEVDSVEDVAAIVDTFKAAPPEMPVQEMTASGIRFVADVDTHGWLKIKWEDGTTYPDVLPLQLKVEVTKIEAGREHFTVKEGLLKGKKGSVKLKASDGASFLSKTGEHKKAASLELDLAAATVTIKDVGTFKAELDTSNPIPAGTYDLEIPFEIHHLADKYLKDSTFATTWFRIGHTGDRFLHPGSVSAGCATVLDHSQWTNIYNHLVRSRKDDQSVGTLVVK